MGAPRKLDHDVVLNLLASGLRQVDIARRIGAEVAQVNGVVERARKKGDPRTVKPRDAAGKPHTVRDVGRPGVMVVAVSTMWRDGTVRSSEVSLPRLSILSGWTGRA